MPEYIYVLEVIRTHTKSKESYFVSTIQGIPPIFVALSRPTLYTLRAVILLWGNGVSGEPRLVDDIT